MLGNSSSINPFKSNLRVLVTNLAPSVTQDDIIQLFEQCDSSNGAIRFVNLNFRGSSAQIGFSTKEGVQQALALDGTELKGTNITVSRRENFETLNNFGSDQKDLGDVRSCTVFITGLGFGMNEDRIRGTFELFGEIQSVRLICGPDGKAKGFGYVTFVSPDAAQQALGLNNTGFDGQYWTVEISREGCGSANTGGIFGGASRGNEGIQKNVNDAQYKTISIGNLSIMTTENGLRRLFEQCGEIESVKFSVDHVGRPRGFAYITFVSPNAALGARALHGVPLDGQQLIVRMNTPITITGANSANTGGIFVKNKPSAIENTFNSANPAKTLLGGLFVAEKNKTASEAITVKRKTQVMFEKLYTSKKFADVTFEVQGEEILAHKAILAQESKHFEQIFSSQSGTAKIPIADVTPATFKGMLEYVYRDEVKSDEDLIIELLKLSEKYSMPDMKLKCENTLGSLLSTENFVKIAKVIEEQKTPKLKDILLKYTLENGVDKIDKKELNEVPRAILLEMVQKLSQRTLHIK